MLIDLQARRVMLVIDPALVGLLTGQRVIESMKANDIDHEVFDAVSIARVARSFGDPAPDHAYR